MPAADIRWQQRFANLRQAMGQLERAIDAHQRDPADELIGIALIKAYEFSFELSWKTLKDVLAYGGVDAKLPREVLKQAFAYDLISDGQLWIDMLEQRTLMAHTYDQARARQAITLIAGSYWPALGQLRERLEERLQRERAERDAT